MKGSYRIVVSNASLQYDFTIHRNITIIKGNSATGKTTLVEMIREYYESGPGSGIRLTCKRTCRVIGGRDWKIVLESIRNSIVFIDEDNAFLASDEFAEAVRESDNYYVLVTREGLPNLPYSVEEIYGIRESGKYASLKQTYNEFYRIYGWDSPVDTLKPEVLLTVDSNAGYEFFYEVAGNHGVLVKSAAGKSNVFSRLLDDIDKKTVVVADGAAFGAEMDRVMKLIRKHENLALYLPESFEWMILQSGVVQNGELTEILQNPEIHIESSEYFSWERFFTELLIQLTRGTYLQYSKKKINPGYLCTQSIKKILAVQEHISFQNKEDPL